MTPCTYAQALLELSTPSHWGVDYLTSGLWGWDEWIIRTDGCHPPCYPSTQPSFDVDADDLDAIQVFSSHYFTLTTDEEKAAYFNKVDDNDAAGRTAWMDWVRSSWARWNLNDVWDGVLIDRGGHPYQHDLITKGKFPGAHDLMVAQHFEALTLAFFGEDGHVPGRPCKPLLHVQNFLSNISAGSLNRQRKSFGRDKASRLRKRAKLVTFWEELENGSGANVTVKSIQVHIRETESFFLLCQKHNAEADLADGEVWLSKLRELLLEMGCALPVQKNDGKRGLKTPKALRDLLASNSNEEEISSVSSMLWETIANLDDVDKEIPDFSLNEEPCFDWSDGVGVELGRKTTDELWAMLGLSEKKIIPGFNAFIDPSGRTPKTHKEWFQSADETELEPLRLKWHQLIALVTLLFRAFEGKPMLLMDDVGVGKTIQILALFATIAYFHDHRIKHGKFPGVFHNMKWSVGTRGSLSDEGALVVVPVGLHRQWLDECNRFFVPGAFHVAAISDSYETRGQFYQTLIASTEFLMFAPHRRITIITSAALQSDFVRLFALDKRNPSVVPKPKHGDVVFQKNRADTIWRADYNFVAIDEIHVTRNNNEKYFAAMALGKVTHCKIGLTATPITTRPQDLWNIGRLLQLPDFGPSHDAKYVAMVKAVNSASARDRRERSAAAEKRVRRGEHDHYKDYNFDLAKEANKPGNQRKEVSLAIKSMRRHFAGAVLRRTKDSVDLNGESIIQLDDYYNIILCMTLHDWELEKLNTLVDLLIQTPNIARKNVGTNFYLPIRRGLIWWPLNDSVTNIPKSLEDYEKQPSTKISATATICAHHLASNNAAPLKFDAEKNILVEDKSFQFHHSPEGAPPDKIIIYCSWPSANGLIKVVLPLLGVAEKDICFINGSMSIAKRKAAQDKFNAIDGPRVCIISGAAQVGLNLFRANIMIIVDTTWSATDDHQLIGRMWCSGQKKKCFVYRTIIAGSADLFLNSVAMEKGVMNDIFTGKEGKNRTLFGFEGVEEDADDGVSEDETKRYKTKSKAKASSGKKGVSRRSMRGSSQGTREKAEVGHGREVVAQLEDITRDPKRGARSNKEMGKVVKTPEGGGAKSFIKAMAHGSDEQTKESRVESPRGDVRNTMGTKSPDSRSASPLPSCASGGPVSDRDQLQDVPASLNPSTSMALPREISNTFVAPSVTINSAGSDPMFQVEEEPSIRSPRRMPDPIPDHFDTPSARADPPTSSNSPHDMDYDRIGDWRDRSVGTHICSTLSMPAPGGEPRLDHSQKPQNAVQSALFEKRDMSQGPGKSSIGTIPSSAIAGSSSSARRTPEPSPGASFSGASWMDPSFDERYIDVNDNDRRKRQRSVSPPNGLSKPAVPKRLKLARERTAGSSTEFSRRRTDIPNSMSRVLDSGIHVMAPSVTPSSLGVKGLPTRKRGK